MPASPARVVKTGSYTLFSEAASARTATGNGSNIALPEDVSELFVGLNVTAVSGTTPTLTLEVQQEDANGVFQRIDATASITATGTAQLHIGDAKVLLGGRNIRLRWVIGGTTPSFTFQAAVHGR